MCYSTELFHTGYFDSNSVTEGGSKIRINCQRSFGCIGSGSCVLQGESLRFNGSY